MAAVVGDVGEGGVLGLGVRSAEGVEAWCVEVAAGGGEVPAVGDGGVGVVAVVGEAGAGGGWCGVAGGEGAAELGEKAGNSTFPGVVVAGWR